MRIHFLSPIILSLLPAISTAITAPTPAIPPSNDVAPRDATNPNPIQADRDVLAMPKAAPKGTLDVPVDGQDGRPHAGPWVETSAERDRKKSGSGYILEGNSKTNTPSSILGHLGPDGMPYPHSNDGVMDDPNRSGPKEGTRGTEGGVSEKQKENRLSGEKVPGGPKEAPPLPHSEQQKLPTIDYSTGKDTKGSESAANLGVLEVNSQSPGRI